MMNTDHLLGALAEQIGKLRAQAARAGSLGSVVALALEAYAAGRQRGLAEGWQGAAVRMGWVLDEATRTLPEPDLSPGEDVVDWHASRRQLWLLVESERQQFAERAVGADVEANRKTCAVELGLQAAEAAQPLRRRLGAWLLLVGSQLSLRGAS